MDIVYTIKYTKENEELIYSLRSLKNIPHDNVYFVGGCPAGINKKKIKHISIPALSSKYDTTTNNLYEISKLEQLSENFIWMNDDFFILQKIEDPIKELNLCKESIESWLKDYRLNNNGRLSDYMRGAERTEKFLHKIGIENPTSYELHIPFIYNKYNVNSMFNIPDIFSITALHKRSVYGNLYIKNSTKTQDCKVLRNSKLNYSGLKFLSCSDQTWSKVKPYLESIFKEKSEYEL